MESHTHARTTGITVAGLYDSMLPVDLADDDVIEVRYQDRLLRVLMGAELRQLVYQVQEVESLRHP